MRAHPREFALTYFCSLETFGVICTYKILRGLQMGRGSGEKSGTGMKMSVETGITEESVRGTGNNLKHPLGSLFGSKDANACLLDVHLLVLLLSLQFGSITPVTDMHRCLGSGRRRGTGTGIEKRRGAQKSQRPGMRPTTGERRSRWVVISSLHSLLFFACACRHESSYALSWWS